ncbi:MAG: hypothetical protein HY347_04680 [candidate division NC10 bacterium]|nr:hypothetical protein [candidate division NC10 bacterium]
MDLVMSLWPFFLRYGYAILFFGIALENAGLPLPGEIFLLAAGFLASTGPFKLPLVIALGAAGNGSRPATTGITALSSSPPCLSPWGTFS